MPQIFEINTNPVLGLSEDAGVPMREESLRMTRERLLAEIGALPLLKRRQGWRGWLVHSRFRP